MNEEKKKKNKIIGISIGILVVLLVVISSTYAYWQITKSQNGANDIIAACLDIDMQSVDGTFGLNPAWPISDSEGMNLTGYKFKVINKCEEDVNYIIGMDSLEVSGATYLSYDSIKVSMDNAPAMIYGEQETIEHIAEENDDYAIRDSKKIATSVVKNGQPNEHIVKVWIKSDAPVEEQSKVFSGRMFITGGQNIENDKPLAQIIATGDISKTENDNVTYKYYDNGDLIISGTGETKDFDAGNLVFELFDEYISYHNIELSSEEMSILSETDVMGMISLAIFDNDEYTSFMTGGTSKNKEDLLALATSYGIGDIVPALLEKIDDFKFRNIEVTEGVTYLGTFILSNIFCESLTINVDALGEDALNKLGTESIEFGNNLKLINNDAFEYFMVTTKTLKVPDTVEEIVGTPFRYSNIETLILPANEKYTYVRYSFSNMYKLTNVIIPENITAISEVQYQLDKSKITLNFYGPERTIYMYENGYNGTLADLENYKQVNWNYTGE